MQWSGTYHLIYDLELSRQKCDLIHDYEFELDSDYGWNFCQLSPKFSDTQNYPNRSASVSHLVCWDD